MKGQPMKIEGKWKEELTTIETMTVKQLAQVKPVAKRPLHYGIETEVKKIMEVEPLNDEYVAVKFKRGATDEQ
jgi:hypothetical protein